MTERDPVLSPFEALVGSWATAASHPLVDAVVPGRVTFAWWAGGQFLVQRSHHEHELLPDSLGVIGAPETTDGLVMEYFDSRGVRRIYRISLNDGVLRIWREHATFAQRFSAALADHTFIGRWQVARTPDDWQDDVTVTYRRETAGPVIGGTGIDFYQRLLGLPVRRSMSVVPDTNTCEPALTPWPYSGERGASGVTMACGPMDAFFRKECPPLRCRCQLVSAVFGRPRRCFRV